MPKNKFICDCHSIDEELVAKAKDLMSEKEMLRNVADFFDIIGDETRCKLLFVLKETPMCVCDLANVLSMTKSSISHQLSKLKNAGIVKCEKIGKQVFYSLDDDHVFDVFEITFKHISHKMGEKE